MKQQLIKYILESDLDGFDCEDDAGNNYSIFWVPYMGEWLRLDYVGDHILSKGFDQLDNHIYSLPDSAIEFAYVDLDVESELEAQE